MLFTSQLMTLAHRIRRTTSGLSWGDCIRQAMKADKLKSALCAGIVLLRFRKSDGSETERLATLQTDYLPNTKPGAKPRKASTSPKVTFWSLTDNGFRSFIPSRLIGWEGAALSLAA